jgi:hypothetical protein
MDNHVDFEKLEIPLVSVLFVVYEKAHKILFSLPKFERYTLGEKIENTILEAIITISVSSYGIMHAESAYTWLSGLLNWFDFTGIYK